MTDKEKIRAEIERLLNEPAPSHDSQCNWEDGYWCALYKIEEFIDSLQEESVSEDLKNAADNALESISDQYDIISVGSCLEMFRLGAKWQKEQFEKDYTNLCNGIATVKGLAVAMTYNKGVADTKEQMMEKVVETTFNVSLPSGLYDKLWIKGCKEGDKLLVIKKDEL